MTVGEPRHPAFDGAKIECHVFLRATAGKTATIHYVYDDGATLDYQKGKRSEVEITARTTRRGLEITTRQLSDGFGPCQIRFVLYDRFSSVTINRKPIIPKSAKWIFAGTRQNIFCFKNNHQGACMT